MEILKDQPSGSFMVRDSSSNPGCHAISLVAPDGEILHYLIVKDVYGYYINVRKYTYTHTLWGLFCFGKK